MKLMFDVINHLAVKIGPRPPASVQEEEAASYLHRFFQERGLASQVIPFRSVRTFSLTYSVYYMLSIAAALIFPLWPLASLLLAVANLCFYLAEINTFHIIGALISCRRSHNTVARQPASAVTRRTVVLSAHLDSSRSGILFSPPLVLMFRAVFLSGMLSIMLIPALLALSLILQNPLFWQLTLLPALSLLAGILLLLQREIFGRYTAGANDNASAVAVLAALADHFAKNPAHSCELYFVGTGSEESGNFGMVKFLKEYKSKLTDPLFINLESLGCGELLYVKREGMFPKLNADSYLQKIAEKAAANNNLPFTAGSFHTILTDNVAMLARNLRGLTLMGCGPRQLIPHWHQLNDMPENIREENLRQAVEMAKNMVLLIDADITA